MYQKVIKGRYKRRFYESAYCNVHAIYVMMFTSQSTFINILCLVAIVDPSAHAELNLNGGTWEWNIMAFLIAKNVLEKV